METYDSLLDETGNRLRRCEFVSRFFTGPFFVIALVLFLLAFLKVVIWWVPFPFLFIAWAFLIYELLNLGKIVKLRKEREGILNSSMIIKWFKSYKNHDN